MISKRRPRTLLFVLLLIIISFANQMATAAPAPVLPNPIIYLTSTELIQQGGKQFLRYNYDVFNKSAYPADMFAEAPSLPPCGKNTKASRTWVDIYDQSGKQLYGFCAFSKPSDLNQIWFVVETNVVAPSWIYIELNDRQTNTKYKSNLAETSL